MTMNGYVKNVSNIWTHAMKRSVGPGATIPLDELYDQYGKKHDLAEGQEFVQWLKQVKLKDSSKWKIHLTENQTAQTATEEVEKAIEKEPKPKRDLGSYTTPIVKKEMEVADVVGLSVRKAREVVPGIMDLNLLKYALQEANQLAGKDSLCRILRKRVRELQLAR
jgi:hypothetical protein